MAYTVTVGMTDFDEAVTVDVPTAIGYVLLNDILTFTDDKDDEVAVFNKGHWQWFEKTDF